MFGVGQLDSLDQSKSFGTYYLEKWSSNTLKYNVPTPQTVPLEAQR